MKKIFKVDKTQPIRQLILEMKEFYPFGYLEYDECECLVKYRKNYNNNDYDQTKKNIQRYCRLRHKYLLEIKKAYQSQKNCYFQIFYEYIHNSFENSVRRIKENNIEEFKAQLMQIVTYLINNSINPEIKLNLIGFQQTKLKYFLSFQAAKIHQNYQKKQLILLKSIQIQKFFNSILQNQKNLPIKTDPQFYPLFKHSNQINNYASNINFCTVPKQKQPRNSSLTNPGSAGSIHQKWNKQSSTIFKIKSIDDKINILLQKIRKGSTKLSDVKKNSLQKDQIRKSIERQINFDLIKYQKQKKKQKKEKIDNKNNQQKNLNANKQIQRKKIQLPISKSKFFYNTKHLVPTKSISKPKKQLDLISIDTYQQQLGQIAYMPKLKNTQMRQTTKSPPNFFIKDKLHQSVGTAIDKQIINQIKNMQLNQISPKKKSNVKQHDIQLNKKQIDKQSKYNRSIVKKKNSMDTQRKKFQSSKSKQILNSLSNSAQLIKNKIQQHLFQPKKEFKQPKTTQKNKIMSQSKAQIHNYKQIQKNYSSESQLKSKQYERCVNPSYPLFKTKPSISQSENIYDLRCNKESKQIKINTLNQRIKEALIKTQATLQIYKKLGNISKK